MIRSRLFPLCAFFVGLTACSGGIMVPSGNASSPAQTQISALFSDPRAQRVMLPKGVRPAPVAERFERETAEWSREHPLRAGSPFRDDSPGQYLWFGDARGAIWQTKAGSTPKDTGAKVVGALYDCNNPLGLKIDHAGNMWVACAGNGTINMYAPKATKATLVLHETRTEGSTQIQAIPDDVAFDASGNVYVGNEQVITSNGSGASFDIAEVDVFLASSKCGGKPCNNATPDIELIDPHANSCTDCQIVESAETFVDVDARGNLYEDFLYQAGKCGRKRCKITVSTIGVDVVAAPLKKNPTFKSLVRGMIFPGGLYITSKGRVANVLDRGTDIITQYTLPSFHATGTLGPTPQDKHFGDCDPFGIGFNEAATLIAAGDTTCHDSIVGLVAKNQFASHLNLAYGELAGAAFGPSDK